jgi:signal peptidase I
LNDSLPHAAVKCGLVAEVTRSFGESRLKVTGLSMLPTVHPGDEVTVRRKSMEEMKPGQIVLFHRNDGLVAHRIVGNPGPYLLTRGDALPYADDPVQQDEIVGEVVSVSRAGRSVDPGLNWSRRMGAWLLCRSGLCLRIFLRLRRTS